MSFSSSLSAERALDGVTFSLHSLSASIYSLPAWGLTNITVDDTNNMIKYKGNWDDSSSHTSSLDFGGSHTLSSDSSASATFTFTGVAVCVLYPLWPYPVSVMVTVDGGVETILNLTDPIASPTASGGSESSQSDVRWCMAGLSNSSHEAVVSMAPSGNWVVVDGFIYTVDNSYESATSSIASHASATATGSSGVNSNGPEVTVLAIALGASVSVAILLTAVLFFFFRCRRRRSTFISVTDNSIPLDNISLTPYVAPPHPQRTTKDISSCHISLHPHWNRNPLLPRRSCTCTH
ncbi:uncharacterized protein EV420DRAFT_1563356 [Desarmillaria tabescens]|uniref:Uncharacterized protein n=1 Tax=Armillaria tabescens TaxID=1929756 RepID=A0AA39JXG2_ARMTA|nr:uncharacterized protein EV420DRAFT_1563356 [Desarmillaria tabescens]KAK0450402.1 hypothetical protein EV420DRAFT_1563356 [Desarmillaria tabescens]